MMDKQRFTRLVMAFVVASAILAPTTSAGATGAVQVSGAAVPWPVAPATCDPGAHGAVDYVLAFAEGSGDLTGCLYGVRESASATPAGTISIRATEIFDGCFGAMCGTFRLEAHITSKWEGEPGPGGNQIFGRCQHKVVAGSGTDGFDGVSGRLDFKDEILRDDGGQQVGVIFNYAGHLQV